MFTHPELHHRGSQGGRSQDRLRNCLPEIPAQRSAVRHDGGLPHPFGTSRNNVGVPSEGAEPSGTVEEVGASTGKRGALQARNASASVEPQSTFHSHTLRCRESNVRNARQPVGITTGHISDGNTMLPALAVHQNRSMPSISDLLHLAVTATDFVGDLDPATLEANCQNSCDLAADIYEDRHGVPVPLSLIQWARCALLLEAEAMLRDREAHAEAERLDAYEAGDLDRDGNFIPWERYP